MASQYIQMIRSKCQTCFNYVAEGRVDDATWGKILDVHMTMTGHKFSAEPFVLLVTEAGSMVEEKVDV